MSEGWPAKRNRIQEKYESRVPSLLSSFCQNVFTNIPSPFADGNGTHFQQTMAAALQIRRVFTRGSSYESAKAIQSPHYIPGLKLTNKADKSRAMSAYLPGVTPAPFGMAADKCIMHYHYALSVCNCVCGRCIYV